MVTRQSLCGWSMEGLRSSVELGSGLVFGKLGEEAVELLPNGQSPRLPVHIPPWEILVCPPVGECSFGGIGGGAVLGGGGLLGASLRCGGE